MDNNIWPTEAPYWAEYMTFTNDHDEEDAAERYRERYGEEPEWITDDGKLLRLGPVGGHRV